MEERGRRILTHKFSLREMQSPPHLEPRIFSSFDALEGTLFTQNSPPLFNRVKFIVKSDVEWWIPRKYSIIQPNVTWLNFS